mmetsp:Transcript_6390/g.19380  ORF Transcript_6390/g.19380 Transcript_6390/m.19380 type:complete len:452 (+) Transcript_6390:35-1390(+)
MQCGRRRPVRGLAVSFEEGQQGGSALEDTISRMSAGMNTTLSTNGVSISQSRGLTVDGEALPAEREVVTRSEIAFEAEGFLGQGASSIVRKAYRLRRPETKYAVKLFKIFDEGRRHQLMKEVRILFALDCQALVQFHGAFLEDSRVGVILEYMDAGSLEKIIDSRGLPERIIAAIMYQVLWGLAYLHFENRLHRDVKPANVLVNSRGEVKLSDFGISRELSESTDQIASTMVGTFRYMSPERLHGSSYSFESDVWSVGVVTLDAARGEPLFSSGATPVEIVQLVKDDDFARRALRDAPRRLSATFESFVVACLSLDPATRPSCDALLNDHPWLATAFDDQEPSIDAAADLLAPWLDDFLRRRDRPSPPADADRDDEAKRDAPGRRRRLDAAATKPRAGPPQPSRQPSGRGDPLNQTYRSDCGDDDDDDDDDPVDRTYHDLAQTIQDDDDDD